MKLNRILDYVRRWVLGRAPSAPTPWFGPVFRDRVRRFCSIPVTGRVASVPFDAGEPGPHKAVVVCAGVIGSGLPERVSYGPRVMRVHTARTASDEGGRVCSSAVMVTPFRGEPERGAFATDAYATDLITLTFHDGPDRPERVDVLACVVEGVDDAVLDMVDESNRLVATVKPLVSDDVEALRARIAELESQLSDERLEMREVLDRD